MLYIHGSKNKHGPEADLRDFSINHTHNCSSDLHDKKYNLYRAMRQPFDVAYVPMGEECVAK